MVHIPHLFLPGPWNEEDIRLNPEHEGHLSKATTFTGLSRLIHRRRRSSRGGDIGTRPGCPGPGRDYRTALSYSLHGGGRSPFTGSTSLHREKLAELGVDELCWVSTRFWQGDPPGPAKARAWAIAALEQSRGAWLMEVSGPVALDGSQGCSWSRTSPRVASYHLERRSIPSWSVPRVASKTMKCHSMRSGFDRQIAC